MGQEGKAAARLRRERPPAGDLKIRNPRENMAAPVELLVEAIDGDDSLTAVRVELHRVPRRLGIGLRAGYLQGARPLAQAVQARLREDREVHGAGLRPALRTAARPAGQVPVEIFNAPPVCKPGPDVKATLGVPAEIEGKGKIPTAPS